MIENQAWTCKECGRPIDEPSVEPRQPCPQCGSIARTAHDSVHETSILNDYLKTHLKRRDNGRKVVLEVIEGDDYYRKTGKWNIMRRIIDRANDWYEEVFYDRDTNEIVHQKQEPLSEHRKPNENGYPRNPSAHDV